MTKPKATASIVILLLTALFVTNLHAQGFGIGVSDFDIDDDDLKIGGDIFDDFNEDLATQQVMEDERFYRYGRFYSFSVGVGITGFDGNRGIAYENEHPTFGLNLNYFLDFRNSFGLGFEFSKHHFFLDQAVQGYQEAGGVGLVEVNMLRLFFDYRYYIDTANLGTAITYSNPYLTGRIEYWYVSNKFIDQSAVGDDSGGGLGFGLGGGLEFPVKMKESYVGVEVLYHVVNFHDKYTQNYRAVEGSDFGYDDFSGNAWSTMVSYVFSW